MGLFSFVAGLFGGNSQKKAADQAAKLQYDSNMAGLAETARQFDATRADFAPYQALGSGAAPHLGNLVGTNGTDAQMAEIAALKDSPLFKSLMQNGTDANLAAASATGGLRGGNFQDAQQRFGADTLNSVIANQLANYSGLVGIGSGASGAVGNFGANAVAQENASRNAGADALAQARLVRGGINARNWQNAGNALDQIFGMAAPGGGGFSFSKLFI